jgi:hypothetical protein
VKSTGGVALEYRIGHQAREIARGELVREVPAHGDDDDLGAEIAAFEELMQRPIM